MEQARRRQVARGALNGDLTSSRLDALPWSEQAKKALSRNLDQGLLTGRGYDRVRRVSRTLADLEGSTPVRKAHVLEALAYRAGL